MSTTTTYQADTDTWTVTVDVNTDEPDPSLETFQDDGDRGRDGGGECGNLDTPDAADLNAAARECAARRGWAMEGGRYPIRSKEMHGASDLSKAIRAVGRGGGSHDEIRQHIMKRARSLGMSDQIPENWTSGGSKGGDGDNSSDTTPATFQDNGNGNGNGNGEHECPEGKTWDEDAGECVTEADSDSGNDSDSGDRRNNQSRSRSRSGNYAVTAAGTSSPPVDWFDNPNLTRATPLTVNDDGRVFGHLATWGQCHTAIGNKCVTAPRSVTNYALFKTGEVSCADGSRVPVGKITLGTGHADPALGLIPAAEHYDNTGSVVAVVNVGEDRFGIWVAGAPVAGADEAKLAELRRSPLSGDWRRINGNLELVAALAVNAPGFPVLRASMGGDEEIIETLLAAGAVTELGEPDRELGRSERWETIVSAVRADRIKKILEG